MADDLDRAQALSERERDNGIAGIRAKNTGKGSDVCIGCGMPIEPGRRKAVPSARRCIECQLTYEDRSC